MSAFVNLRADVKGPFATEEILDSFWDREERSTVQLVHRIAGYDPMAPDYTRWTEDRWIVRFSADSSNWYENKADAVDNFNRAKAQANL